MESVTTFFTYLILFMFVSFIGYMAGASVARRKPTEDESNKIILLPPDETIPKLRSDMDSMRRDLQRQMDQLPGKVLESITSSTNGIKGKLGEMIGYIQLNAEYDRLISFGDITDFIGIKFPTDTEPGSLDFIDIKNGKNAKLSKDQQKLKKLIEDKKINFIKVKVDTDASQDQPD